MAAFNQQRNHQHHRRLCSLRLHGGRSVSAVLMSSWSKRWRTIGCTSCSSQRRWTGLLNTIAPKARRSTTFSTAAAHLHLSAWCVKALHSQYFGCVPAADRLVLGEQHWAIQQELPTFVFQCVVLAALGLFVIGGWIFQAWRFLCQCLFGARRASASSTGICFPWRCSSTLRAAASSR